MEKLIATTLLLVMMVALSFGGNHWNNPPFGDENSLKSSSFLDLKPDEPVKNNANQTVNLASKHFMKFKVNGVLDSFPVGKEVADGNYNYADNMFQAKLTVKDHSVIQLSINGTEIPANEIKNQVGFINKIIMRSSAPPQYDVDSQPIITPNPDVRSSPNAITMPLINESNGEMVVTNPDGSQTVITHNDNGEEVQSVITTQKDGSRYVTKTYKNGETISETFDRNGKRVTLNKVGGSNNISINQDNGKTYINGNTVTVVNNDGSKSIMSLENDGVKSVKIYNNNNQLLHTLKLNNGQTFLDGKPADENELRALGWEKTSRGLQKIGGYNDIHPDNQSSWSTSADVNVDENKTDRINDLREEMIDLKSDIKDCTCQSNVEFRKKLVARIDKVVNNLNKGLSENDAMIEFKNIQRTWESGECDDDKGDKGSKGSKNGSEGSGSSYSYGIGDNYVQAEKARKDAVRQQSIARSNGGSSNDKALKSVFNNLKNEGYISLNKHCSVVFSNTELNVDGVSLKNKPIFNKIKSEIADYYGNTSFSIAFSGVITNITSKSVELDGSLMTNINKK